MLTTKVGEARAAGGWWPGRARGGFAHALDAIETDDEGPLQAR